ncbi:hypothetical protein ABB02_00347 [Clostridiaceae bacterium JG1575]|nr:hypothetical protein ABB02_00347 [Clostridiaceae bacterium JG1575]
MAKNKAHDLLIKIFCLIASFGLWVFILTTTNPAQRHTFSSVPVQIQNAESLTAKGLILMPGQSLTARVTVEGPVNEVYTVTADSIVLVLDLNQRTLKAGEQEVQVTLVQMPQGMNLVGAKPTVKLQVEEYLRRPVDIRKDKLVYSAAPGYYVPEPRIELNFAMVSGPKKFVDEVAAVKPISNRTNINTMIREMARMEAVDAKNNPVPNVTLQENYVEVTYHPQPVKEVKVEPVHQGQNDRINLTSITAVPNMVRITSREPVLRSISELKTESLDIKSVEPGDTKRTMRLVVPPEVLVLDARGKATDPVVDVHTSAQAVTTRTYKKNLTFAGTPLAGKVKVTDVPVQVVIASTKDKLDQLSEGSIVITVNIAGLGPGDHSRPVEVNLPEGYTNIKVVPSTVQVTIEN